MGWLYGWHSASAVRDHLRDQLAGRDGGPKVLADASTKYGRHYWALVETRGTKEKTILLCLINGGGSEWGYKDIDESCGPVEVDCPLRLLDAADEPPNEWAREWREKVRAYHAKRKGEFAFVRTLKKGDKVELKRGYSLTGTFTIDRVKPLRGYHDKTGILYRLSPNRIQPVGTVTPPPEPEPVFTKEIKPGDPAFEKLKATIDAANAAVRS